VGGVYPLEVLPEVGVVCLVRCGTLASLPKHSRDAPEVDASRTPAKGLHFKNDREHPSRHNRSPKKAEDGGLNPSCVCGNRREMEG